MKRSPDSSTRRVVLAGASGYIGRAVARELHARGHTVIALLRPGTELPDSDARLLHLELTDPQAVKQALGSLKVDALVSCIASRSGVAADAWRVDHDANQNLLGVAQSMGVNHFLLLSAICVQKPRLAFQEAKLAFESALASSGIPFTIVRPTAFFKSLSGQLERVKAGRPFLVFGDGSLTACKPISEADLARFMVDQLEREVATNGILPIGGPGPAVTLRQQGEIIFDLLGKTPQFRQIPPRLLSGAASLLKPLGFFSGQMKDKAELARIGHYYATESMLVWDPRFERYDEAATPETGSDTLRDFYAQALESGLEGQELGAQRLFREVKKKP